MEVVYAVVVLYALLSIARSLRRIENHNAKFLPVEAGRSVRDGDILLINALGFEQMCKVTSVVEHPDGVIAVKVETTNAS